MSFGEVSEGWHEWVLNQEQTDEMIKRALDLGINFFDTANIFMEKVQAKYSLETHSKNLSKIEKIS